MIQKLILKKTWRGSLLLLLLCFFLPIQMAQAKKDDPCQEIKGNWKGSWHFIQNKCVYDVEAQGAVYKDVVRLDMKLTTANLFKEKDCPYQTFVLSGYCKGAELTLKNNSDPYYGTVFEGLLEFSNPFVRVRLTKI